MENTYKCNYCKKYYKTIYTLNKHIKNTHVITPPQYSKSTEIICDDCNKKFASVRNLHRHHEICKLRQNQVDILKLENDRLKNDIIIKEEQFKNDMDELKKMVNELLNKNCKMHYKTLQKINTSAGRDQNNGIINNNTINIVALGREDIDKVLTKTDKLTILNKKENALPYMIELVHFNDKFPQFKNIAITNNRNNYAHVYDPDNKVFKLVDKNELIDELIDYRVCDIEEYYIQYKDEIERPVRDKIKELIDHRGDNDNTKDKIKLLLFNNRYKIAV